MDATDSIPVEYDLRPAYYDDFHCLAGDCRMTCCKGWHITFDRKDYMKLKRVQGSPELDRRMAHCLRRIRSGPFSQHFGEFQLNGEHEDCPLHRDDGLCLLQLEKGHETLPLVCRIFPRVEGMYFSGYFERALSPACEGVLALLWDLPDGVDFRADPLPKADVGEVHFSDACRGTMMKDFQEVRSRCIDILQDRRTPLSQRMMLLGLALKKLVDGETDLERWLAHVQLLEDQSAAGEIVLTAGTNLALFLINNVRLLCFFSKGEVASLGQELLHVLNFEQDKATRGSISVEPYLEARVRYEERFAGREYFMENLMVSVFFQLKFPALDSMEKLWKSYVAFCNMYGFYRFLAVMSCREGAAGDRDELFRMIVFGSREMVHGKAFNEIALDSLYQNDSMTLAHMAILLNN